MGEVFRLLVGAGGFLMSPVCGSFKCYTIYSNKPIKYVGWVPIIFGFLVLERNFGINIPNLGLFDASVESHHVLT